MIDITAIDWNEVWKEEEREKRQREQFSTCAARWSDRDRCRKFSCMAQEDNWKRSRDRIAALDITPDSRVLDIGAGPGTLAVPLAGMVRHVTAVEPSEGMRECLAENIGSRGIRNITVVPKAWEDICPGTDLKAPYDIVVASYSLGVPDLKDALLKMDAVTGKSAYIFWFADMASPRQSTYREIWEELFGSPLPSRRKPNIIFNLLNQIGIYANVRMTRVNHARRFRSIDDAMDEEGNDLNLTTPEQVAILKKYLEKTLRPDADGFVMERESWQAMMWWDKEERSRINRDSVG